MTAAFLQALCFAGKSAENGVDSRILLVQLSPDDPNQNTKFVNGIFAAQKLDITIDTLVLLETPT